MSELDGIIDEAGTQRSDWVGTLAADDPDLSSVAEKVGLDPDRYWVLGFRATNYEGGHFVDVFAVDREVIGGYRDLLAVAAANAGVVPVIKFSGVGMRVPDVTMLFKRFQMVGFLGGQVHHQDIRLKVDEKRELPFGDPDDEDEEL